MVAAAAMAVWARPMTRKGHQEHSQIHLEMRFWKMISVSLNKRLQLESQTKTKQCNQPLKMKRKKHEKSVIADHFK